MEWHTAAQMHIYRHAYNLKNTLWMLFEKQTKKIDNPFFLHNILCC